MFEQKYQELNRLINQIFSQTKITFEELLPSKVKGVPGILVISDKSDQVLYIDATTDLRRRLYTNHLMGNESTARLKKRLIEDQDLPEILTYPNAKEWIIKNCHFHCLDLGSVEEAMVLEGALVYVLDPKYVDKK